MRSPAHSTFVSCRILGAGLLIVMALAVWIATLGAGTYLGSTALRADGLLIMTPRRPSQPLSWQEIDDIEVAVFVRGSRNRHIMGVRVTARGNKGIFLPGMLKGRFEHDPEFDERLGLVESAWQQGRPRITAVEG